MKKQIPLLAGLMSLSPALWAHSGEHYGFWSTLWHVVSQPDHLFGILGGSVLALAVIAGVLKIRRRLQQDKRLSSSLQQ